MQISQQEFIRDLISGYELLMVVRKMEKGYKEIKPFEVNGKTAEATCRFCQKSFQVNSHRNGRKRLYCTLECRNKWHKKRKMMRRRTRGNYASFPSS